MPPDRKLNATAACVLGLLQLGPAPGQPGFGQTRALTGWQLWRAAATSVARFWNLTRSQIYVELPRLQAAGLIEGDGAPGSRGQQPYRITAAGSAAFTDWLSAFVSAEPRDEQLRSPLLLAVFFGDFLPRDGLRRLLEEHRLRHQRRLEQLEVMLQALGDDRSPPSLVALRGARYQQLMVDWIGEALARAWDATRI